VNKEIKLITAAVTYIADQIPAEGMLREAVDARVAEIIMHKIKSVIQVNHELSPALPRDPCHVKPYREFVASCEIYVLTKAELNEITKRG
jgi:hypothetical protein